jgi:inner membrane transporter RhtA
LIVGFTLLDQTPGLLPVVGLGFVVAAGVGAERSGARQDEPSPDDTADFPLSAPA